MLKVKNKLKTWRHAHQMNQTEFANFLGLPFHQYNRYELNRNQPTLAVALHMAKRLNLKVEDIFYEEDPSSLKGGTLFEFP